ncbi:MAG: GNAT family N-acetyltransferase [Bacteroidia bacterium]|nr:GNAT family N-acetyltransferase [Bacteroidia bacterium]
MKIKITETADPLLLTQLNKEVQNLHATMQPHIFKPFDEQAIEMAMRKIVSTPNNKCHIASIGSEICGYMISYIREYPETAFTISRKSLYIDQIAVIAGQRNKGIGKALLKYAYHMAIYANIRRIELDHWTSNSPASQFFKNNGFSLYREMLMKEM